MKKKIIVLLRLIAAVILMQTLYFKFTAAPESVYIFSKLGIEPWGRWFSGCCELLASLLLIIPSTQFIGALFGLGIITGALLSHVFVLGFVVQNDKGLLFGLACITFFCCLCVLVLCRAEYTIWKSRVLRFLGL